MLAPFPVSRKIVVVQEWIKSVCRQSIGASTMLRLLIFSLACFSLSTGFTLLTRHILNAIFFQLSFIPILILSNYHHIECPGMSPRSPLSSTMSRFVPVAGSFFLSWILFCFLCELLCWFVFLLLHCSSSFLFMALIIGIGINFGVIIITIFVIVLILGQGLYHRDALHCFWKTEGHWYHEGRFLSEGKTGFPTMGGGGILKIS